MNDLLALALDALKGVTKWADDNGKVFRLVVDSHSGVADRIHAAIAALEAAQSQAKDRNKEVFNGDHIHIENGQYVHTRTGKTLCLIGEQSVGVPAGMKLVPIELTADMKEAWDFSAGVFRDRQRLWDSVLAAAPSLPVLPVDSKPFLCNGKDWIPVSRTTLNRLGNHELIRSALGKLSPHDLGNLGLTDDESNAIEALYNLTEAADFVAVLPVDENNVTLDKRDLFAFVRGAIKDALTTDDSKEQHLWEESTNLTIKCLSGLYEGSAILPVDEKVQAKLTECRYPRCNCVVELNGSWNGCKSDAAKVELPVVAKLTCCGYCDYEESDGSLIEQCGKCKAADAQAAIAAQAKK